MKLVETEEEKQVTHSTKCATIEFWATSQNTFCTVAVYFCWIILPTCLAPNAAVLLFKELQAKVSPILWAHWFTTVVWSNDWRSKEKDYLLLPFSLLWETRINMAHPNSHLGWRSWITISILHRLCHHQLPGFDEVMDWRSIHLVASSSSPVKEVTKAWAWVPRTGIPKSFPASTFDVPSKPPGECFWCHVSFYIALSELILLDGLCDSPI